MKITCPRGSEPAAIGELRARVRDIVSEVHGGSVAPGVVVTIVAPRIGPAPISVAVGWADREARRPMSEDTQCTVGSITKLLTATLVMQHVERGELGLDEPVNDHLPERRWLRDRAGSPAPVTFRQLLTHTSGLPPSWRGAATRGQTPDSLDTFLDRGLVVHTTPGERCVYANPGFAVLGAVLAARSGQRWADFAREQLLAPLGMSEATFASPWDTPEVAAAYGDMLGGSHRSAHVDVTAIAPASGLIASSRELGRFVRMLLAEGQHEGRSILSPESVRAMTSLQRRAHPDLEEGFGFGFGVREHGGRRVCWWDGALPGAAARLAIAPEHEVGVVVLANQTDNAVSASLVGRLLEVLAPTETPSYSPSRDELASFVGAYQIADFVDPERWYLGPLATVNVTASNGSLHVDSWVTGATTLAPEGPGRFRFCGSAADGAAVLFDGGALHAGFVRGAPMPWWRRLGARVAASMLTLLALAARLFRRLPQSRSVRRAPGPSWASALRLLPLAARDPLKFTEVLGERHGGVVRIPAPGRHFVLVTEPEEVERILVHDRARFAKNREFIELTPLLLGQSLLTTEGEAWVQHRRALRPLFSGAMARRFTETVIESTRETLGAWEREPGRVDVGRDTNQLALRIIGGWLGGADLREHSGSIKRHLDTCQGFFLRRLAIATLVRQPNIAQVPRRVREAIASMRAIATEVIERRRLDPSQDDALSFLLRLSDDAGALDDEALLDHTITLLVAGHETSGIALAWMLDQLARHPEVVRRLREEADAVLGDRALEPADLERLPYATQVAHEVIRLYPSLPLIGRDVCEPVTIGGARVPAGATVILSSWAMQRRADLWPDPTRFDPSRFADGAPEGERRFSYVPFGAGPRVCIGARMTIQQVAIAATLVARSFDLRAEGPPPAARVRATLAPSRSFRVTVRPRPALASATRDSATRDSATRDSVTRDSVTRDSVTRDSVTRDEGVGADLRAVDACEPKHAAPVEDLEVLVA